MVGHISSASFLWIVLVWLSVPSVEAIQQVQNKSLEAHIQEVTGRESVVNCGEYEISAPRSVESLRTSLVCAEDAAKQHKPFRIVVHLQGIDSSVAHGVLSSATGSAYWFHYDSAPCGAPGWCADRFETTACRLSDVVVLVHADGRYELGLKR